MISIIMPVYNAEKDLHRSITSVLSQSGTDFELILIDDGSTDKSSLICDQYAAKDSRVHVRHKINEGVSTARNLGLDIAIGDYILFIDSDDIMQPNALSKYLANINGADLVISEWGYLQHTGNILYEDKADDGFYSNKDIFYYILTLDNLHWSVVWNKLYRREIINKYNVRFDERVTIEEDLLFNWKYICHAQTLKSFSEVTYFYCGNPGSAVCRKHSFESFWAKSQEMDIIFQGITDLDLRNLVRKFYIKNDLKVCDSLYYGKVNRNNRLNTLLWLRNKAVELNINISYISGRYNKIIIWLLKHIPLNIADIIIGSLLRCRNSFKY